MQTMTQPTERHRLLGGFTRARLLGALRQSERPLGVSDLAALLDRHPNSVREQLDQLIAAGLVTSTTQHTAGRGRPRHSYVVTPAVEVDEPDGHAYQALARALTEQLAHVPDARAAAIDAGKRWGRGLVADQPAALDAAQATGRLIDLLDGVGFEPDQPGQPGDPIRLHHCPFGRLARERQDIVCGVHLGLMRGVLDGLGASLEAVALEPFVTPDLCLARLAVEAHG